MDPITPVAEVENSTQVSSKKPIIFAVLGLVLVVTGLLIYSFMFSVNRPPALAMKGGLQGLTTNIRTGFVEYDDSDVSGYSAPEGLTKESFAAKSGVIYLYSDVDVNVKNVLQKYIVPQNGMAAMVGYWSSAKNIFVTSKNTIAAWQGQILMLKDDQIESGDGVIPAHTGFFIITNKATMDIYGVKSPVKAPVQSFDVVESGNVGWNLVSVTKAEYEKLNDVPPISIWKYAGGDFVREATVDSSKLDNYLVWLEYNEKPADIDARVKAEADAKVAADAKAKAEADAKAKEEADKAAAENSKVEAAATVDADKAADDADVANAAAEEANKVLQEAIANAKNASDEAKVEAQKAVDAANLVAAQALKDKEDAENKLAETNIALENAQAQKESKAEQEAQAKAQKAQADADAQAKLDAQKILDAQKLADAAKAKQILSDSVDYAKALLYLPFEGSDLTANKGTLGGKVTLGGVEGEESKPAHIFDNGMYFDGKNDYISANDFKVSWSFKDWSMSVWADEPAGTENGWRGLISNRSAGSKNWVTLGTSVSFGGVISVEVGFDAVAPAVSPVYIDSKFNPAGQGLVHYVLTHDYSQHKLNLYINGELNGSLDVKGKDMGDLKSTTYIGKWFTKDQSWNGEIKLPAIYGSELSAEQVKALYEKMDPKLIEDMNDSDFVADKLGEYQAAQEEAQLTAETEADKKALDLAATVLKDAEAAKAKKLETWYAEAWGKRKLITVDSKYVYSDLDNFPVLVNLSKDSALQGAAKTDGSDILFTLEDGKTKLAHEIEKYDNVTGDLVAWVNVPKLLSTSDTKLYMYYGNAGASSQQDASAVWGDNYAMIQHMNGNYFDSTKNKNNGVNKGEVSVDFSSKIGGGAKFEKYLDYISVPTSSSLDITDEITTSAWINTSSQQNTYNGIISKRYSGTYYVDSTEKNFVNDGYTLSLIYGSPKRVINIIQSETNSKAVYPMSNASVNDGKWHLVTGTYDQKSIKIYIDGAFEKELTLTGKIQKQAVSLFIGQIQYVGLPYVRYQYYGLMDEVRVSPKAMSTEWIRTEFENQNSPETFYSVGVEEKF
ncbi:MAG: DUF2341 domain-containing protein [Candidatus Peregrinibacteria bacterium]|nr:DUF2341 domain-containing protein [Candidatus Peregrinibacteria bacterium]